MTPRRRSSWLQLPIFALFVVFAAGCASESARTSTEEPATSETTPAAATDGTPSTERVREVARISLEIEREPGRASAILEANGLTADEFENLLYAIAGDAALTELYETERSITPAK